MTGDSPNAHESAVWNDRFDREIRDLKQAYGMTDADEVILRTPGMDTAPDRWVLTIEADGIPGTFREETTVPQELWDRTPGLFEALYRQRPWPMSIVHLKRIRKALGDAMKSSGFDRDATFDLNYRILPGDRRPTYNLTARVRGSSFVSQTSSNASPEALMYEIPRILRDLEREFA